MSANEKIETSATGAAKAGNDERYDLIPAEPLRQLAKHFGVGAKKYADRNWEKGLEWHMNYAALNRHLWAFWSGEDIDAETGSPHIIAVAWHAFALAEYAKTHPELDDRPSTLAKERFAGGTPKEFYDALNKILLGGNMGVTLKPDSAVSVIVGGDNPAMDNVMDDTALYPDEYFKPTNPDYPWVTYTETPVGTVKSGVIKTEVQTGRLTDADRFSRWESVKTGLHYRWAWIDAQWEVTSPDAPSWRRSHVNSGVEDMLNEGPFRRL